MSTTYHRWLLIQAVELSQYLLVMKKDDKIGPHVESFILIWIDSIRIYVHEYMYVLITVLPQLSCCGIFKFELLNHAKD